MSKLTGWLYTLRSLVRRNEADREMAGEIAFHIERQTRKNETLGLSAEEAGQRALQEFVRRIKARRILDLAGSGLWEGDLAVVREDRGVYRTRRRGPR